jgi:SWI/SNF-related matrix-associated actin-dependent regulator of chromatin subfamily A-like protein 1
MTPVEREAALRELAVTHKLSAVKNPEARAALAKVIRRLKVRLPHTCAPHPFQLIGIAYARLTGYRALIGDAPGLGKTIQALCAIAVDPKALLPAIVICPSSVLYNWRDEAEKWLPTVPTYVYNTSSKAGPGDDFRGITITTWDLAAKVGSRLLEGKPRLVIADEAHYAKEPASIRSRALRGLATRVPHRLLLTGTPIKNKPIELWHLLHCINPKPWGTRSSFSATYTQERLGRLNIDLRPVMVRRLKSDVLQDLPDKQIVHLPVAITAAYRKEYNQLDRDFKTWLGARGSVTGAARAQAMTKVMQMWRLSGRAKVSSALEQIEGFMDQGEPLIVFAYHKDVVAQLRGGLEKLQVKFDVLDGSVGSAKKRQEMVQRFQAGETDVIVCTTAAKEGITLHRASNVLFVERWWTPTDEQQAADRAHRIGQKNAVTVWYLHAKKTIDDHMRAVLARKQAIIEGAVGDTAIVPKEEVFADLLEMLRSGETPDFVSAVDSAKEAAKQKKTRHLPPPHRVHTLLFDKNTWSAPDAQRWAYVNGFGGTLVTTEQAHLLKSKRPPPGPYRTVPVTRTIRVVITNRAL